MRREGPLVVAFYSPWTLTGDTDQGHFLHLGCAHHGRRRGREPVLREQVIRPDGGRHLSGALWASSQRTLPPLPAATTSLGREGAKQRGWGAARGRSEVEYLPELIWLSQCAGRVAKGCH